MASPTSSSPLVALSTIKILKPSVWGDDDPDAAEHVVNLVLEVSKRRLVIAQEAGANTEVFLRFCLPISDFNLSVSVTDEINRLVLELRSFVQQDLIYSGRTQTKLERSNERGLVRMNCTLPVENLEVGSKVAIRAEDDSNEEGLQMIIQSLNSLTESGTARREAQFHHSSTLTTTTPIYPSTSGSQDIWAGLDLFELQINKRPALDTTDAATVDETPPPSTPVDVLAEVEAWQVFAANSEHLLDMNTPPRSQPLPSIVITSPESASTEEAIAGMLKPLPKTAPAPVPWTPSATNLAAITPVTSIPALARQTQLSSASIAGKLAEQEKERVWNERARQWAAIGKRSKYKQAPVKAVSRSQPVDENPIQAPAMQRTTTRNVNAGEERMKENTNPSATRGFGNNRNGRGGMGETLRGMRGSDGRLRDPARDPSPRGDRRGSGGRGSGRGDRGSRGGRGGRGGRGRGNGGRSGRGRRVEDENQSTR